MTRYPRIVASMFSLFLVLAAGACGGETSSVPPNSGAEPTKADLISTLRDLQNALDAADYASATKFLVAFPGMSAEQMQQTVAGFVEQREISPAGIDILEAQGQFGPLLEVFPDGGGRFAEKAGVDAKECYAISHGDAQVAAHWDGQAFRLIRLDDVGKLE